MDYNIIVPIFLVLLIIIYLIYKSGKSKPSGSMAEWDKKIKSAELNEELYSNANDEEKEDLIYYFTQKLRIKDNFGKTSFAQIPQTLKVAYLVNELETEVNNGGFLQFFTNSSGQYVNETIESLELIRADYTKKLLENAIKIMLRNNESTTTLNEKINSRKLHEILNTSEIYENKEMMEEMNKLDMKFYDYVDPLSKLKLNYINENQIELWEELNKI